MLQYLVAPHTIRAASVWTDSSSFFSSWVMLLHTTSAYSNNGRIIEIYILSRADLFNKNLKDLSVPMRLHALLRYNWMWTFHFPSSDKVSPKCLCSLNVERG